MKKKWIIIITISVCVILIGLTLLGPLMSNVEQPKYQVISTHGNIQIREYSPLLIAMVKVKGERKEAISQGFRILADFIFGNNTSNIGIAMTAPVEQQTSKKIAMTAPVQQQQSTGNSWTVSFVMPSQYSIETIPRPNNQQVILETIPKKKYIIIRFSGVNSQKNIDKHEQKLMAYINKNKIQIVGSAKYAFYNPPWTLPFLRRNEVMFELERNR